MTLARLLHFLHPRRCDHCYRNGWLWACFCPAGGPVIDVMCGCESCVRGTALLRRHWDRE